MKVINDGENIVVEANFEEMSKIVYALDRYMDMSPDDNRIKKLVNQLHNPKIY